MMTRADFDAWVPPASPLRQLAADIASINIAANPTLISNSACRPDNFLANGETGLAYSPPTDYSRASLAEWKSGRSVSEPTDPARHGFSDGGVSSKRGIALLFDPFVDAFLSAHFIRSSAVPQSCTVIVLSDYYPLSGAIPAGTKGDWGLDESIRTLCGVVTPPDSTTRPLLNFALGTKEWENNCSRTQSIIADRRLLLWNFFPFFRGGTESQGRKGLPKSGNWHQICWGLLCRFLEATGATRVVIACSKEMLPLPALTEDHTRPLPPGAPDQYLQPPPPLGGRDFQCPPRVADLQQPRFAELWQPPFCVREVYRVYHPRTWWPIYYGKQGEKLASLFLARAVEEEEVPGIDDQALKP